MKMAVYKVECHNCNHAPYYVTADTPPTSCQYCGSTNIIVTQVG